jgi:UDP:flavonoid glycosyltransferase YjiC (YdhE family)
VTKLTVLPFHADLSATDYFVTQWTEKASRRKKGTLSAPRQPTQQRRRIVSAPIKHFEYVPLSAVLAKTAVLVHHGGIGTMAHGFRAGVPQLITPIFFDQPANAARLAQLGAGETIRPRHYSVDNAACAFRPALNLA